MASSFLVAVIFGVILHVNGQGQPQLIAPANPSAPLPGPAPPAPAAPSAPQAPAPAAPSAGGGGGVDTLPAGYESVIGSLRPGFSCDGKVYGYYADVTNDCKVFHVCWPIVDEHGATLNKQWTFICGNQTLFNQERLVCDRPENVNCASSEQFFTVNNDFGKIPGAQ